MIPVVQCFSTNYIRSSVVCGVLHKVSIETPSISTGEINVFLLHETS